MTEVISAEQEPAVLTPSSLVSRQSSIDGTLVFDVVRQMFPTVKTPADATPEVANECKRRRMEAKRSPWTVKGDLATLRAAFGKGEALSLHDFRRTAITGLQMAGASGKETSLMVVATSRGNPKAL
jgi:hypothetical protein